MAAATPLPSPSSPYTTVAYTVAPYPASPMPVITSSGHIVVPPAVSERLREGNPSSHQMMTVSFDSPRLDRAPYQRQQEELRAPQNRSIFSIFTRCCGCC